MSMTRKTTLSIPFRSLLPVGVIVLLLLTSSCGKKSETATRSFYMGSTPWPADFTLPDADTAYAFLYQNSDIISQHFDDGIPYEECLKGSSWPQKLVDDIQYRRLRSAGKNVFLSISALDLTRKAKAVYYAESAVAPATKALWLTRPFNDPDMINAYVNYVEELIRTFQPVMLNYGVESNLSTWDPAAFDLYKKFLAAVFIRLKTSHPDLPIFLSVMVEESAAALENAAAVLPWSDYLALSAYPYLTVSSSAGGNTDPDLFPANYFTRFLNLAPQKPLAFAETGYIAEDLVVPAIGLNKKGTQEWQQKYLRKVLDICDQRKARLLIWFCSKDYDKAIETMKTLGIYQDLFAFWRDIGLYDSNGQARPAFTIWKEWQSRPRVQP